TTAEAAAASRQQRGGRMGGAGAEGGADLMPLQIGKLGGEQAELQAVPVSAAMPEREEAQAGVIAVVSYLLLYLLSWGSSLILHCVLILLCIFLVWQTQKVEDPGEYNLAVVSNELMKTRRRPDLVEGPVRKTPSSVTPEASRFSVKPGEASAPKGTLDAPIATAGDSGRGVPGIPGGKGTTFMGIAPSGGGPSSGARRIIYVIDSSGSMTDSIDFVKAELKRSISVLVDVAAFHVIFFSAGKPIEMPARRLVSATIANKSLAFKFITGIVAGNEYMMNATDPTEALRRAFELEPQIIFFLTDGEFDRTVVDLIAGWNNEGNVSINTISFIYRSGERLLRQIARDNNGIYKFVSEEDLDTIVRQ
ncbi:MAG: hypothetical protein QGD94_12110, partial [Planctomycetia bacterium]|nr:hypothetical protein [Planctomycetia bacterium]